METKHQFVAFDLEIAQPLPEGVVDWRQHRPLGITCAATVTSQPEDLRLWYGRGDDDTPTDRMTQAEAKELVEYLDRVKREGCQVLTWNGLGFDFEVLAEESQSFEACRDLARHHIDMMFHAFCYLGYPISLDRAARGMRLAGKPEGMSGLVAPQMWAEGQRQQVLDYVRQDARTTLELALACEHHGHLRWIAHSGKRREMPLTGGWLSVDQARKRPLPDTSWMSEPMSRDNFTAWLS
jgi:hypothetical protein